MPGRCGLDWSGSGQGQVPSGYTTEGPSSIPQLHGVIREMSLFKDVMGESSSMGVGKETNVHRTCVNCAKVVGNEQLSLS
jgi:hypothetical protein